MAGLNRLVLAYRPAAGGRKPWPVDVRWRLVVYAGLSILAWLVPPWGAVAAGMACLAIGRGLKWLAWLRALGWFWLMVMAPLLTELFTWFFVAHPGAGDFTLLGLVLSPAWFSAAWRCLSVLVLLAGSQWLTATTTVFEIQAGLAWVLRPLGQRLSAWVSLLASLAIGFVPWVLDESQAIQEATTLRGAGKLGFGGRFAGFGLPLFARVFAKARHVAEAIELRGGMA